VSANHLNIMIHGEMSGQDIAQHILQQRMARYDDRGPDLRPAGVARFRFDDGRMRIAFAQVARGQARLAVDLAQHYARTHALYTQWVVTPQRVGEQELPAALTAARFQLSEHLLLMAHRGEAPAPEQSVAAIEPISTWQAMWAYEYGSRQAFQDDPAPTHSAVTQRARERWRDQEYGWCDYYAATMSGVPVAGLYVTRYEEIPTIMGVYTTMTARGQGVATALLSHVVTELARDGRPVCCLFVRHGNPAERVYRRMGFFPLADEDTYTWAPESPWPA
jgi:GNAT superfamily N-acetyltransferase